MSCFFPLTAYRFTNKFTDDGKSVIVFNPNELSYAPYEVIQLPCGNCSGCRVDRSKQWALRCVHESSMFKYNCFITLTFNDQCLDEYGSLRKEDFRLFMKRFRRRYEGKEAVARNGRVSRPIRFFHCGEYGDTYSRPHHHSIIFNYDFDDKIEFRVSNGNILYLSESLERLWSKPIQESEVEYYDNKDVWIDKKNNYHVKLGYCTVGQCDFDSCNYVAGYILKKINGKLAEEYYKRVNYFTGEVYSIEPEYCSMSKRPAIGHDWFLKFSQDLDKDFVTSNGKKYSLPKYYDRVIEKVEPSKLERLKRKRFNNMRDRKEDYCQERMLAKRKILEQRLGLRNLL